MQPSRQHCLWASLAVLAFLLPAPRAFADTLTITSTPPGATVEIDGVVVGTTPYRVNYPGGYFHKTKTVFGKVLEHEMKARVYKTGYATREIVLAEGPFTWTNLYGRPVTHYYLLKATEVPVTLDPTARVLDGSVRVNSTRHAADLRLELPVDQIMGTARLAVVKLSDAEGWGTGFFITSSGVIATNKHVVENDATVSVELSDGTRTQGTVEYTDDRMDLALVKVEGGGFSFLPLADGTAIRPGQSVLAIGNPVGGMQSTVTRGIVSGVGPNPDMSDPGTWIQTDAAINNGNSGGPLINAHGEVIGINTMGARRNPTNDIQIQGINLALSSEDLIQVLKRFYPNAAASDSAADAAAGSGSVQVTSDPGGADIYVDGNFVGQTPSTIRLASGAHRVEVKSGDHPAWVRNLDVIKDSEITLRAVWDPVGAPTPASGNVSR